MKVIDKYILKKLLSTFFFVVFLLVMIIVVIDITEKMERFTTADLTFKQVAGFYLDYIPWLANTIAPITVFIATVFVTANLASHTEIIAILSSGISFRRLMVPYMIGATFIGGVSFYFTGWVIPDTTKSRVEFEHKYLEAKFYFSERDNHFQEGQGLYVYVRNYVNTSNTGYNFTMEKFENYKLVEKLTSNNIKWNDDTKKWQLNNWQLRILQKNGELSVEGQRMNTLVMRLPTE